MQGKKKFMMIKVDLQKAYGRLSWSFIRNTLELAGLDRQTSSAIMRCITSTNFKIIWNGGTTEEVQASRGIRQGNPLSPYIFVLCMERQGHLIEDKVKQGVWKPFKISKDGPQILHLMFADDLLLFAEASTRQAEIIHDTLVEFGLASGQKISVEKTRFTCLKNVSNQ
ncbi:Ribonuclease H [Quillaja saponaria]|uniref:Ribonuclease H n=1 Tax=Quillaja saponaria TaxID=32244 RepID=A0AAD7LQ28_QUISA|nr:Ribonuclease H [Quillaja saponaria]